MSRVSRVRFVPSQSRPECVIRHAVGEIWHRHTTLRNAHAVPMHHKTEPAVQKHLRALRAAIGVFFFPLAVCRVYVTRDRDRDRERFAKRLCVLCARICTTPETPLYCYTVALVTGHRARKKNRTRLRTRSKRAHTITNGVVAITLATQC